MTSSDLYRAWQDAAFIARTTGDSADWATEKSAWAAYVESTK